MDPPDVHLVAFVLKNKQNAEHIDIPEVCATIVMLLSYK
jgi:hypothetical protein